MPVPFDIEIRWPELFAPLTAEQRGSVIEILASGWHEGWTPNRFDVETLIAFIRGEIDGEEYRRRGEAAYASRPTVTR